MQDITEVHQVRQNLEPIAIRLACGHHDRTQLARPQTVFEEMDAADPQDSVAHFELNPPLPLRRDRAARSYLHDSHNVASTNTAGASTSCGTPTRNGCSNS